MPRNLDSQYALSLLSGVMVPFFAVQITFKSGTYYICSLPFTFVVNGQSYTGTGDLGTISAVSEKVEVEATGTAITLSGIDNAILQQSLEDVQQGAPCVIYLGNLDPTTMQVIGSPCVYYQGLVDQPSVQHGVTHSSITINIESRLLRLQTGGQQRRYTTADQRLTHPDDIGFSWVESLNDQALAWGT
jgi:hypothetical protein